MVASLALCKACKQSDIWQRIPDAMQPVGISVLLTADTLLLLKLVCMLWPEAMF